MIQDRTNLSTFVCLAPGIGVDLSGSVGHDLNTDFGQGHLPRKSPLPGGGEEILIHVEVENDFVASAGGGGEPPLAQFHAVLSSTGGGGSLVTTGLDYLQIGTAAGPQNLVGATVRSGFTAADLQMNRHIFIRLNPYTDLLGRTLANPGGIEGKDLRFLGLICQNITAYSNSGFLAGAVVGTMVKAGDIFDKPQNVLYPSATIIKT